MLRDFVDGLEGTEDIDGFVVFDDDRPLRVRAPDPAAFYEAFVAVQQLGEHLARQLRAERLVTATLVDRDDQYLYRVVDSAEGRVSVAARADVRFDLAGTVERLHDDAGLGDAETQPPPPTAADAVPGTTPTA